MIFNWINHPAFRRDEQLLAVLYELGMATRKQISVISGWTEEQIEWSIKRIRKWGKTKEERDEWIKCHRLPLKYNRIGVFTLGRRGIQYVADMMNQKPRRKEAAKGQIFHYLGLNNILCRLVEAGAERSEITWLSTLEALDFLGFLYESKGIEFNPADSIRPDARLKIGGRYFWIEFDNDTEGPRQLEKKFHEYTTTLVQSDQLIDSAPIVWVTLSPARRDYLEKLWIATRRRFDRFPEMKFFVQGDETDFLLSEDSFLAQKQSENHSKTTLSAL